jgi:uncharacterized protein YjbI with pentapeptide repeats
MQQSRNAEEALWAVLNACARVTQEISLIKWPSPESFGAWISRLRGQRAEDKNVLALECLSFLDLHDCVLGFQDLYGANLRGANLEGVTLHEVNLSEANLERTILEDKNISSLNETSNKDSEES